MMFFSPCVPFAREEISSNTVCLQKIPIKSRILAYEIAELGIFTITANFDL